jgi:peptidyl-dipeptidase Dcp
MLRPYFKLENVIKGVFQTAEKLYDITFEEVSDVPKYHEEVKTYKVSDKSGEYVGLFYADFFPRETKRPGAWMTDIMGQGLWWNEVKRPIISIVCNFTKPTNSKPSLLTLNEVQTLFHEFGHALHGLLSKCKFRSVAGTSVFWDFVELPSQLMENWVLEKDCLDLFAVHYETGEKIPADYIAKIKKSQTFLEGLMTLRQLSFGYLDMAWHTTKAQEIKDLGEFEKNIMKKYSLFPQNPKTNMSCSFGHIFAGGYSAGYYSYKWAEVLDADAFEYFKETGVFNKETAKKFKENILEKGGSDHPLELYKQFRGKEPDVDALMRRAGFIS